jgi:NADPH:quinone reductase-like Zn-dependent oxidoreductase
MDPLRASMIEGLADLAPMEGQAKFISTVTGGVTSGPALDAAYWWSNARSPVRFKDAVATALEQGANLFVEVGPHPILAGPLTDVFGAAHASARVFETLNRSDEAASDPVLRILAQLVANGAGFDPVALAGPGPLEPVRLPSYPFQRDRHLLTHSAEALTVFGGVFESQPRHPLLGARMAQGSPEWRTLLDPLILPYLSDHRANGVIVAPASSLIEMALAAGRDLHGPAPLSLSDFDVLNALVVGADETREISTRFAEATQTIEIWSRKRFAEDKWLLNARGRLTVLAGAGAERLSPPIKEEMRADTPDAVYAEALRAGLDYGPMFRLVRHCERDEFTSHSWLDQPAGGLGAFTDVHVLNPISFDAAFHGLFISRPQCDGETKAHLPVRFHKVAVFEQGAKIHQAITHLTHETDRYKTVSINFLGEDGALVASVEGAVLRAVWFARASVHDRTFRRALIGLGGGSSSGALAAVRHGLGGGEAPKAWLLTRAFCLSLAHRTLEDALKETGAASLTDLRGHAGIAEAAKPYFESLVTVLADGGLLDEGSALKPLDLPAPDALLSMLMQRHPEASFEIQAASIAMSAAGSLLRTGQFITPPVSLLRRYASASCALAPSVAALTQGLDQLSAHHGRVLRILALEPESAGLARVLAPLVDSGRAEVTVAVSGKARMDGVEASWGLSAVALLDLENMGDPRHGSAPFDALVGLALSGPVGRSQAMLEKACSLLAPAATILIALPLAEAFQDVLLGVWKEWFVDSASGLPALAPTSSRRAVSALRQCGVRELGVAELGGGLAALVTGEASQRGSAGEEEVTRTEFVIVDDAALTAAWGLEGAGLLDPEAAVASLAEWMDSVPANEPLTVYVAPHGGGLPAAEEVARRIETLRDILQLTVGASREVAVLLMTKAAAGGAARPEDVALRGFAQVAINEYPAVDLRLIHVGCDVESLDLRSALAQAHGERDISIGGDGVSVERVWRGLSASAPLGPDERSRLRFRQSGRVESFEWIRERRIAPRPDEIEIEVAATGLNFRDVLVGLGVLDDEILQAGLTNASLGFECSGVVLRVGEKVEGLSVGDRVMGFASGALASHVTAPAWQFTPMPASLSLEAAATIPVAFATAWHSLIERAHLRAGHDVLIHGAAGGVGLAAIQIARRAGARVIGTASNEARRRLALTQGADLVFDSRGQRFVESVRAAVGGVDVALNSLDGAAMLATFELMKPFGRFVELGKKDFLDNTHLGLRPFVRNITYMGVDLDELLSFDRKGAERIMGELVELFAAGQLRPLPHQICEAHEIGSAFRAMQASEHVGKIVIRPARYAVADSMAADFNARPGAYLIVGGLSGLGFATAQWLARKGATTLVLASRRGVIEEALKGELETLRASGVTVLTEALDVRDGQAVKALTLRLARDHGPLRGVIHAAVQLDDGLIAGLEGPRLRTVLETKIDGALNLDAATADQDLDFFVLYSSATTVIGSPGQAAYVAANAYLEGFARRRRQSGRPGLAIGWGAISDVGLIARDRKLGERLQRSTGVIGVRAAEALAHLGRLLALGDAVDPLQFYTMISPGPAAAKLALLKSPAYAALGLWRDGGEAESLDDLDSAIRGKSRAQAHAIILKALRREAAQILRMAEDQIDPHRPLSESGFDSLMLLELVISVERLTGLQLRVVGGGERTLASFATDIVSEMMGSADGGPAEAAGEAESAPQSATKG